MKESLSFTKVFVYRVVKGECTTQDARSVFVPMGRYRMFQENVLLDVVKTSTSIMISALACVTWVLVESRVVVRCVRMGKQLTKMGFVLLVRPIKKCLKGYVLARKGLF